MKNKISIISLCIFCISINLFANSVEKLIELKKALDAGIITQAEFDEAKNKFLQKSDKTWVNGCWKVTMEFNPENYGFYENTNTLLGTGGALDITEWEISLENDNIEITKVIKPREWDYISEEERIARRIIDGFGRETKEQLEIMDHDIKDNAFNISFVDRIAYITYITFNLKRVNKFEMRGTYRKEERIHNPFGEPTPRITKGTVSLTKLK